MFIQRERISRWRVFSKRRNRSAASTAIGYWSRLEWYSWARIWITDS
jgi:hypothetical protein